MPLIDAIRRSLDRRRPGPEIFQCSRCEADFSLADASSAVEVECPFCGSNHVRQRG